MPPAARRLMFVVAIVFAALGGLGVTGLVDARLALIAAVLLGLVQAAAGFRLLRDAERVLGWVRSLATARDAPPGRAEEPPRPAVDTPFGRSVVQTVRGIDRALREKVRRATLDAATGAAALDSLHDPVVILAEDRSVLRGNDAAYALFGRRMAGRDIAETLRQPEILAAIDAVLGGAPPRTLALTLPVPVERVFEVRVQRFDSGEPPRAQAWQERWGEEAGRLPAAILSLHDQTAIHRSEQLRADFVTNASHELKTPLASLIGFIETLRGPARDDAAARERFLAIMHDQANRMARLVGDLMSLSRIELDEHVQPTAPVALPALVRAVADGLELKAAAQGKRIVMEVEAGLPPVAGDADQLHQLFQNLLDNAVTYSRPDTVVTVTLRHGGERRTEVTASVADQGEGIPRHHLPRLTERFYRVDPARSRAVGGTGLGLAIVKHIVNRHRGRLEIDSEVGRGTTVTVHLPSSVIKR